MTGPAEVITITAVPVRRRHWGRIRGAWAVLALLVTAAGHLAAAWLGVRPVVVGRRLAAPFAAAWRSASHRPTPPRSGGTPVYITASTSEKDS